MDPNQTPTPNQTAGSNDPVTPSQPAQVFQPEQPAPAAQPDVTPAAPSQPVAPAEPVAPAQPVDQPAAVPTVDPSFQQPVALGAAATGENPDKHFLVALALSYFLGSIGADRFYLNKNGTAVAKLLTLGGLGIWQIVDLILVAFGKLRAKGDDRPLEGFAKNRSWVKVVTIVLILLNIVVVVGVFLIILLSTYAAVQQKAQNAQYGNTSTSQFN